MRISSIVSRALVSVYVLAVLTNPLYAQIGGGRDGFVVWEKISRSNNTMRIWKANLDGSQRMLISGSESGAHMGPVISTDGRRVAYARISNDNGAEYPAGMGAGSGPAEIWVVNRDGSNRRKVYDNALSSGEHRWVRWLSATHLAIGTAGGTFRVRIPESGMGYIEAGTLTGGRQTNASGLIVRANNNAPFMVTPTGNKAYRGDPGGGNAWRINTDYYAVDGYGIGGCQAFVGTDDRYGVAAEYNCNNCDKTAAFPNSDPSSTAGAFKGTYNSETTSDGKRYDYFPTISNDNAVGAQGKSSGAHSHRTADYDIILFNLSVQNGLLRATSGTQVNITGSTDTDRWPDVWVSTGPAQPAMSLSTETLSFLSEYGATTNPASQQVQTINTGGGNLPSLSAASNRAWLSASVSGSGNTQSITVSVNKGSLAIGSHTGSVTVSGSGLATATVTVTFTVKGPQVATSITISPAHSTIAPGQSVSFTATVRDAEGDPMSASVSWSVSGGGFISSTGEYTHSGAPGSYTVTAVVTDNQSVSKTATVDVAVVPVDGLQLWLRADAGVTAGGDNLVSLWQDQSGNSRHATQTNNANKPLLVANGYNGKPVLRFNGSQFLDHTLVQASPFTVFMVYRVSALTNELLQWVISASVPNGACGNHGYHAGSLDQTGFPTFLAFDGTCMAEKAPPPVGVFRHMVSVQSALYFDGVRATLADTIPWAGHRNNTGTLTRMAMRRIGGFHSGGTNNFNGDIAEILFYDRELDIQQRSVVERYLNEKYGVQPITVLYPNGHETLTPGQQISITWRTGSVNNVNLHYSIDGGEEWIAINATRGVTPDDAGWGAYPWTVPAVNSAACFIRIEEYGNVQVFDVSNHRFTIGGSTITAQTVAPTQRAITLRADRNGFLLSGTALRHGMHMHLYDCRGALVTRHRISSSGLCRISVPSLGSGNYLVVLHDNRGRHVLPLTVMP